MHLSPISASAGQAFAGETTPPAWPNAGALVAGRPGRETLDEAPGRPQAASPWPLALGPGPGALGSAWPGVARGQGVLGEATRQVRRARARRLARAATSGQVVLGLGSHAPLRSTVSLGRACTALPPVTTCTHVSETGGDRSLAPTASWLAWSRGPGLAESTRPGQGLEAW